MDAIWIPAQLTADPRWQERLYLVGLIAQDDDWNLVLTTLDRVAGEGLIMTADADHLGPLLRWLEANLPPAIAARPLLVVSLTPPQFADIYRRAAQQGLRGDGYYVPIGWIGETPRWSFVRWDQAQELVFH
jgi:hypothetical protein